MQHADIPPPQSAALGLHPVTRELLLNFPERIRPKDFLRMRYINLHFTYILTYFPSREG